MDTPPCAIEVDNLNEKYLFTETFDIQANNNQLLKLKISYNQEIIFFEIEEQNNFFKIVYNSYQALNNLLKIDKYFRQFDTLQEVFNSLKVLIQNKNLSIIKDEILIKIKIINTSTNKEFFIILKPKEKNIKEELNNLVPYVMSLNKKIENLENKIKQMEENHKKEILLLRNEINELKSQKIAN